MEKGKDFTGISVGAFIHDGNGEYLFGLRTENCRDEHGKWEPAGGGALEFGDTIESTLIREAQEEIGAKLFNIEYIGIREAFREHKGVKTHWLAIYHRAQVNRDDVKILEPDMCAELEWRTIDNLPTPLHSQIPGFLEVFGDKL